MHAYLTNASIQLLPIVQDRHPYAWVDEVIEVIAQSGLPYEVGPFGTAVEGSYEAIRQLIDRINLHLYDQNCPEWLLNVQWQMRNASDITISEKTEKHKQAYP